MGLPSEILAPLPPRAGRTWSQSYSSLCQQGPALCAPGASFLRVESRSLIRFLRLVMIICHAVLLSLSRLDRARSVAMSAVRRSPAPATGGEDSIALPPTLGVVRGPVLPLYLTTSKEDYLLIRATRGAATGIGAQGGARSALDPVLVLRAAPPREGGGKTGVEAESLTYQEAIKRGLVLGNELEREVHGLLGVITLLSGPYLVTIEQSEVVGLAPNYSPIRRITRTSLLPVSRKGQEAALQQQPWQRVDEKRYLGMVQAQASSGLLFFSHKYPLHQRTDLAMGPPPDPTTTASAALEASSKFLWNSYLLQGLEPTITTSKSTSAPPPQQWGTACISGYAATKSAEFNGGAISLTLISRRSSKMQGTRFNRRGVSGEGDAANFVETEMVLHRPDGSRVAHVQLRGSLPMQWRQEVDLTYTPRVTYPAILPTTHIASCARHVSSLRRSYGGSVLLVNLIDSCGSSKGSKDQAALGAHLAELVSGLEGYQPLDNHSSSSSTLHSSSSSSNNNNNNNTPVTPTRSSSGGGNASSAAAPALALTWFDFHTECAKMKWHRLSRLLARIDRVLTSQGRTEISTNMPMDSNTTSSTAAAPPSSSPPPPPSPRMRTPQPLLHQQQVGVVRTNCMDNLDRTNVVQSIIARRVLLTALLPPPDTTTTTSEVAPSTPKASGSNGISSSSSSGSSTAVLSSPYSSFESAFKDLWASNADALSLLYAGTPALKTDFVRTGRRTLTGALQDGVNSLTRYYINNFWDGRRQDAVSLFLGEYRPSPDQPSPFPPYPLPSLPGGVVFSLSYGLQSLPPYRLTLQLGSMVMHVAVALIEATAFLLALGGGDHHHHHHHNATAAAAGAGSHSYPWVVMEGGEGGSAASRLLGFVLWLGSLYLMLLLLLPAFLECLLFVGPCATWRRAFKARQAFTDRPLLLPTQQQQQPPLPPAPAPSEVPPPPPAVAAPTTPPLPPPPARPISISGGGGNNKGKKEQ